MLYIIFPKIYLGFRYDRREILLNKLNLIKNLQFTVVKCVMLQYNTFPKLFSFH